MPGPTQNQINELKVMITESTKHLETVMANNHSEMLKKLERVEETAKEALIKATENEKQIQTIREEVSEVHKEINKKVDEPIAKLNAQIRGALIEIEDLRNRSMRSTLIFRGIPEKNNAETWKDTLAF